MKIILVFLISCLLSGLSLGCTSMGFVSTIPNCKQVKKGDIVHKDGFWIAKREFYFIIRKACEAKRGNKDLMWIEKRKI